MGRFSQLKVVFPSFHLKDKAVFEEREIDTSPTQRDVMSPTQEETTMSIPNDRNIRTTFGNKIIHPIWFLGFAFVKA
jgi:hypothetical protein